MKELAESCSGRISGIFMKLRTTNVERLAHENYDVLIIGGGINGAVSAAALAAKGAKIALIDERDFAGFTSSQSSNLAWGGIKYMETYEFGLVRKLCMSRNTLMRNYPSTVKEIRFLTTITKGFRYHPLFLYLGTILYWFMGSGFTRFPKYRSPSDLKKSEKVLFLENASGGFEYSDAYLYDNDARFVFQFIRSAMNYGAVTANYVTSLGSIRKDGWWETRCKDSVSDRHFTIKSNAIINACGPYVDHQNTLSHLKTDHHHAFSKGIHLIVDRITRSEKVLTFFADDGRLFFVIPMGPKTCIGTTDTRVDTPETEVTDEDRQFVLSNINARLMLPKPLTKADIIAERCGVRPLVLKSGDSENTDWLQLSRKHAIDVDKKQRHLSIYGGKLTDCLNVGDEVCGIIKKMGIKLPHSKKIWFGEPHDDVKQEFYHQAELMNLDQMTPSSSSEKLSHRFWRRYGTQAFEMLEKIREDRAQADLLIKNAEYLRCEIEHAARREMITKLEDFLRRRSKISLVVKHDLLKEAPGIKEACKILFGDLAQEKYDEYFN